MTHNSLCRFHHLDEDTQEALSKKPTSAEERAARDEALKKKADYFKYQKLKQSPYVIPIQIPRRLLEWKSALTSAYLEREPYDSESE